jgi:hypothetical protein
MQERYLLMYSSHSGTPNSEVVLATGVLAAGGAGATATGAAAGAASCFLQATPRVTINSDSIQSEDL